jgi:hypothetical protein
VPPSQLINDLFASLAWPVVVLAIVFVLRKEIRQLVPSLRRLTAGPIEAEFGEGLAHARELIEGQVVQNAELAPELGDEGEPKGESRTSDDLSPSSEGGLANVAEASAVAPRSVILEAWLELEASAALLLRSSGISQTDGRIRTTDLQRLEKMGIIGPADVELFEALRLLRNRAAHKRDLDVGAEDAVEYALISGHLSKRLTGMFEE